MPDKIHPNAFVLIRLACCVVLFWGVKLLFVKEKVARKDFLRLALCGLLGAAANMLFFFHGINLTSPVDASIIMTATPVIVLVFSFLILKEPITKNKLIGITIAGLGALFLVLFTTFFAYLFNVFALNYVTPSVTSSYIYLQPVISFIMVGLYAYILMKDEYAQDISLVKILSCFMVVIGVYIISKRPKKLA